MELTAESARKLLRVSANPQKAAFFPRFFKAGPGGYAEGDRFIGVTVPAQRAVAKQLRGLPLEEAVELLKSPWHEERLTAVFILVDAYKYGDDATKTEVYELYMRNTRYINNWDIVDSSAYKIVGPELDRREDKLDVLTKLAKSTNLWERRISMLTTLHYINQGRAEEAIYVAEMLLNDKHDLIHKAVGWMLRELGKKVDERTLTDFLDLHAKIMPRMMLRYAIERLSPKRRKHYLEL